MGMGYAFNFGVASVIAGWCNENCEKIINSTDNILCLMSDIGSFLYVCFQYCIFIVHTPFESTIVINLTEQ